MFITHEYVIIEIGANSWHVGCITRVFQTEPRLTVVTSTDKWPAALNLIKAFFWSAQVMMILKPQSPI